jgi:hypothetical protein
MATASKYRTQQSTQHKDADWLARVGGTVGRASNIRMAWHVFVVEKIT